MEWNGMEVELRNFPHHGMEMKFEFSRFWITSLNDES
jgi:hypothetical protein